MTAIWRAPGRVNLIGEHLDYNDGVVVPFALQLGVTATVEVRDDAAVHVESDGRVAEFGVDVQPPMDSWEAYVAGVVFAARDRGLPTTGLDVTVSSDLPQGAGLSSSAALCCAVAGAASEALGWALDDRGVAALARAAENDFVGAPTGAMDQLASTLGRAGQVLVLDCHDLSTEHVPLDLPRHGLRLLVVDTRAPHALVSGEYAARRRQCQEAARIVGRPLRQATDDDLALLDGIVLRRARHVLTEMRRVTDVVALLRDGRADLIGPALTASHRSLRDDFEVSCPELDVAVDVALEHGALGARMTGGGFGGSAIALVPEDAADDVGRAVRAAYDARGWTAPVLIDAVPSAGARSLTSVPTAPSSR